MSFHKMQPKKKKYPPYIFNLASLDFCFNTAHIKKIFFRYCGSHIYTPAKILFDSISMKTLKFHF